MNDEIIKNLAQSYANANVRIERLERENAALRRDVYQCPPTSENSYEGLKWADAFDVIERDNAELHNKVTALKHENLALREQIAALGEIAVLNYDDDTVGKCDAITGGGEKYKDVMRRLFVDQPRENAALVKAFAKAEVLAEYMRCDGLREWRAVETSLRPNEIIVQMDRAVLDAARAKEGQP